MAVHLSLSGRRHDQPGSKASQRMAFVVANPAKTDARVPARLPQCPSKAFYRGGRCSRMPVTGLGQLPPQRPKPNLRFFPPSSTSSSMSRVIQRLQGAYRRYSLYPRIVDIAFSQLSADESDKNRRNVSGRANSSSSRGLFLKHIFLLVAPSSLPTQAKWRCQVAARLHSCTSGVGPSAPIARSRVHE